MGSLLATSAALATTYVRVEKDGTKTYSDRPLAGGQPVVLQPAQTYSAPASQDPTRPAEERALTEAANFQYQSCVLTPQNDQTFHNPESVSIALATTPGLRQGHQVTLSVDGNQISTSSSAVMPLPDRGTHTVSAQVTDLTGNTVCSASTSFHVRRTSVNAPARQAPQRPRPTPH